MPRTIAASILLCVLAGCTAPGEGPKAQAGYNDAKPVIAGLKAYRDKHNAYPAVLRDLVPDDLAESAWRTSGGAPAGEFFLYENLGASYRLQFKYDGPGMNRCAYTPEAAKWECAGYH